MAAQLYPKLWCWDLKPNFVISKTQQWCCLAPIPLYHAIIMADCFLHGLGEGEGGSCTNSGMRNNLGKGKGKYKSVDAGNIWGILDLRHYMLTYFGVWCSTAALGSYSTALLHTNSPLPQFYTSSCSFGLKFTVSMQHWEQKLSNYQITWLSLFRFGSYYTIEISKWKLKLHQR